MHALGNTKIGARALAFGVALEAIEAFDNVREAEASDAGGWI
jgi:hypothetical protein